MSLTNYENDDLHIEEATNHVYDPNTTTTSNTTSSANDSEVDDVNEDDLESTRATSVQKNNLVIKNDDLKSLYQANSLAAAQMLQLMSSTGNALNSTTQISNAQELLVNTGAGIEHEKENIPICKYCNKIFANFSNLNHHISAIHLNQSKWICSQCGKVCSSKSNLKVHLRVHLRVKPYHCRWCSYSCMHHSSIRDHLAKVHPDKTHTPLQPGYIFNSQAVPEPDVFNSKGFNITSFVNDTNKSKRINEKQQNERTPEKIKRSRTTSNDTQNTNPNRKASSVNQTLHTPNSLLNQNYSTNLQITPNAQISPNNNSSNNQSMSNIYNAYTMARMLPFMYPMQLQYAAAAAAAANQQHHQQQQQQHQQQSSAFFNNLMQYNQTANSYNPNYNLQLNHQRLYSTNLSNTSNSFEDQTTSSYSNSHSSRSSSLSPTDKTTNEIVSLVSKQMKTMASGIDENSDSAVLLSPKQTNEAHTTIETQTHEVADDSGTNQAFNSNTSSPTMASSPKHNTLTVDQILSNKSNKSTQTESACLKCPYCNNKAF